MSSDLSLYFKLEEGTVADLEILSASAIAWVETMRAAARVIDPNSDIRVNLVDVDQSSAIYNTIIEWFERHAEPGLARFEKGLGRAPKSKKLLMAFAPFVIITGIPTYDFYFGEDGYFNRDESAPDGIEDIEERDKLLEKIRNDPAVETATRKFYRTIEREPKVKAVGLKERPDDEPIVLVPSERFAEAGGLWVLEDDSEQEQVTTNVLEVVLVKPALVHTPRAWTFKPDGLPEFDAIMRDPVVLSAMEAGGLPDRMREGIPMTIRIQTREVMRDGQWKLVRGGRSVIRVISPKIDEP